MLRSTIQNIISGKIRQNLMLIFFQATYLKSSYFNFQIFATTWASSIYQISGLSVIKFVIYRLLLYIPANENGFINIFFIIRLFIVIKYQT